jgi:hypothetical protein
VRAPHGGNDVSSVLIGIIGVALFIGIAIGGAVFLGPQFERSQDSAVASRVMSNLGEIAVSVSSARMGLGVNGGMVLATPENLRDAGFLAAVPDIPVNLGASWLIVDGAGYDLTGSPSQADWSPRYVFFSLGADVDLCTRTERLVGNLASGQTVSTNATTIDAVAPHPSGCFRTSRSTVNIAVGDYVAYVRV